MSKNGGMGSKRIGSMTSKGMGKCSAGTPAEQCGNAHEVSKGKKPWTSRENGANPFHADISTKIKDD